MKVNNDKLLKVFEVDSDYFLITRDFIEKLNLSGNVVFRSGITDIREDLKVLEGTDKIEILTNKKLFRFPSNARGIFANCKVTSLDLSCFDTSNVVNMAYMFYFCTAESIDLSSFNTSNVVNMSGMFFRSSVKHIDIKHFDTSKVVDMSGMFFGCKAASLRFNANNFCKKKDITTNASSSIKEVLNV